MSVVEVCLSSFWSISDFFNMNTSGFERVAIEKVKTMLLYQMFLLHFMHICWTVFSYFSSKNKFPSPFMHLSNMVD